MPPKRDLHGTPKSVFRAEQVVVARAETVAALWDGLGLVPSSRETRDLIAAVDDLRKAREGAKE